jgi:small nuclear ribonucleoprotein E
MNVVLDNATEIHVRKGTSTSLGRILLKGDTISLMMEAPGQTSMVVEDDD